MPGEISDGHWFGASNIYGFLGGLYTASFNEIAKLGEDTYFVDGSGVYLNKDSYAPLEQYLAGFIPPEEVPEFWVAADAEWVEWPSVFTATEIKKYTIDDVIAEHGRGIPGASQAQREFRAAAILLMDNNYPATRGKLEFLSDLITRYSHAGVDDDELSANFYETTGGRARIVMDGLAEFLKDSATVPGAPEGLTAAGNGQTRMDLSWNAPRSDGGTAITGYRVEVSENGSTWVDFAANTRNADTSYSHTGLTAGSTRNYRVSAINSAGAGPASNIATGGTDTSSGNQAPDLVVGAPSVDDSSPTAGESFTLSATVRNQGSGPSASTTLRYYRSTDSSISSSDTAVGTDSVSGLSASGTSPESIGLTAPSTAGTYYYGACVDSVSGESDTTYNCSSGVAVTVPKAVDITVTDCTGTYNPNTGVTRVTGQPIKFFCPERPFWVRVWRRHQHLGRAAPDVGILNQQGVGHQAPNS